MGEGKILRGAYALIAELGCCLAVAPAGKPAVVLEPGFYLYAGSALGAGGIVARLSRHFRRGKALHWHIDRLTEAAASLSAHAFPAGCECAIVKKFLRMDGVGVPVPGFGSSDCRRCPSHLLQLPARLASHEAVASLLAGGGTIRVMPGSADLYEP
jgi:Uri superfamily endonuclease